MGDTIGTPAVTPNNAYYKENTMFHTNAVLDDSLTAGFPAWKSTQNMICQT